jgi:hypothetical protein
MFTKDFAMKSFVCDIHGKRLELLFESMTAAREAGWCRQATVRPRMPVFESALVKAEGLYVK